MDRKRGIRKLHLLTHRLREQRDFYVHALGFALQRDEPDSIIIGAGDTEITFTKTTANDPPPCYHFAFNIPENKLQSAKPWLTKRTPLMTKDGRDDFHFKHWNAHAAYFSDPAGNIVEFIARHDLANAASGAFTSKDALYASEIGLVVDDVPVTASAIASALGLSFYRNQSHLFAPVGDAHQLLIIVPKGHIWSPTRDNHAASYPAQIVLTGSPSQPVQAEGHPYRITLDS